MKYLYPTFLTFGFFLILISCKDDKKEPLDNPVETAVEETINVVDTIPKTRTLTVEDRNVDSPLLTNLMLTVEAKNFVSLMVSAGLTNRLFVEEGPFTVFTPSYIAFENIPKEKLKVLLDYKNKTSLKTLINSHIINGNLDSSTLKNNIDNNNGAYTFKAISGASLTASLNGDKIIIKDENGVAAQLEESDVICSNGVFHLMSAVLGLN